ncbi:hypothetical protein [Consotaella salsifontis]|uniref:Uncharacterized protein n=1 Tax=Consotaella salsifontis TaxID=1365950 RepID=A0A1T4RVC0_9HYPH|nr:hypothetical protein [Consotaella salsifontis]SKA19964.1 hypothetical protein SAMN05428963_1089 [Consotaella salsifontis]
MANDGWNWWAGYDEETMLWGPFDTKEEAVNAGREDAGGEFQDADGVWKVGVHVVEARNDPLRLADWIDVECLIERAEEDLSESDRTGYEGDEGPYFECSHEQEVDLASRIKAACDEWQAAHGLVFTCRTSSAMRNDEYVVVSHPNATREAA